MPRPSLPPFVADLFSDRTAFRALLAGAVALAAAGLDPKVWGPSVTSVQAAIRVRPELEAVVLLGAVGIALLLLVGGAVGDLARARPVIVAGLAIAVAADVVCLLAGSGPLFVAGRLAGAAAASAVIPVALAVVATSYRGIVRATAIGLAYAAYGGATAVAPALVTLIPGSHAPAFVVAIVAGLLALWFVRGRIPDLAHPGTRERPYVLGNALWAGGVVLLSTGVLWLGGGWDNPLRLALIAGGVGLLLGFLARERWRRIANPEGLEVDRRPITVALFVGVVIAIAQTVTMVQMPLYFSIVAGYGPLLGTVALAPLFLALVAAGPIAGFLITRASPRALVGAGVLAVGGGNLAAAALVGTSSAYLAFIVPLALVGGGFVIATTVRTAIIFASVPRGLPATAAALNEASIAVGSRIGIVLTTAIVAQAALAAFEPSIAGLPPDAASAARSGFTDLMAAVNTPSFAAMAEAVRAADAAAYVEAYLAGIRSALLLGGLAAVIGGVVALVSLGRRDPLATVYEHRDEREAATTA